MKELSLEFVVDESGNKKAVVIPFEEWELLQKELKAFWEYQEMKSSLKEAFSEVKQIQKGHLPRKTMQNFLDEC